MSHVLLCGPLQGVGQEFGEGVKEVSDVVGPVQHKGFGFGKQLSKNVEDALKEEGGGGKGGGGGRWEGGRGGGGESQ